MRCPRCKRRAKRLRTGRGPDGRLCFDWCLDCLTEVQGQALFGIVSDPSIKLPASLTETRAAGLRTIGISLFIWGLLLELVATGTRFGFGAPDQGFGLSQTSRFWLFSVSGLVVTVTGAWISLTLLDHQARRKRIAWGLEVVAVGIGLTALIFGIAFHQPKRDPWIIAIVAFACVTTWMARRWSRIKERFSRTVSPEPHHY